MYKVKKVDYSHRNPEIYLETINKIRAGFYIMNGNKPDYNHPIFEHSTINPGEKVCYVNENIEQCDYAVSYWGFDGRFSPKEGTYYVADGHPKRGRPGFYGPTVRNIFINDDNIYEMHLYY